MKNKFKKTYLLAALIILLFSGKLFADDSYDWWWFFYENENSYQDFTTYRPFFHKSESESLTLKSSLPPFIYWESKTERMRYRHFMFGLINDVDYLHRNKIKDYDFVWGFPLIMRGKSKDDNDNYLMWWPWGGEIRGKLGLDYIRPHVFPGIFLFYFAPPPVSFAVFWANLPTYAAITFASWIPAYTTYGRGDFEGKAVLWPLIQWGKSETRSTLRILPFYARYTKKDYYDNRSYLMLFNFRNTIFKERNDYTFFFFPFVGRKWSTAQYMNVSTLMWPFFTWGYDRRAGYLNINFPWPFFQYGKDESNKMEKLILFPVYGRYDTPYIKTRFITPLYFSIESSSEYYESSYKYYGMIYWRFNRTYNKDNVYYGRNWTFTKLWPLFSYEKNDRGDFSFRTFSILPFRDAEVFERIYSPLWSVFEYSSFNENKKLGILMRTYFQYWSEDLFYAKVPLLYKYKSYKGTVSEMSFLLSSFGYRFNEKGKYLKFLWIPVKISDDTNSDYAKNELEFNNEFNTNVDVYLTSNYCIHEKDKFEKFVSYDYGF